MKHIAKYLLHHVWKVLLAIIIIGLFFSFLERRFSWLFTSSPQELVAFFQGFGSLAPLVFILIYVLMNIISVPSIIFIFISGMTFGLYGGLLISSIAELLSASINYYLGSYLAKLPLWHSFHSKKIEFFSDALKERSFSVIFALRYFGVYFDLISYTAGMLKIKFSHFISATILGFLPYLFIYSYAGSQLMVLQNSEFMKSIFYLKVGLLILFLVWAVIYYRLRGEHFHWHSTNSSQ